MKTFEFVVEGTPTPQGSMRAFTNRKTGRAQVVHNAPAKLAAYRADVREAARRAGVPCTSGAVELTLRYFLARPKSHFGTGRNANVLKPSAPSFVLTTPDTSKLLRSTEDALSGVAYDDDRQVVRTTIEKHYCNPGEQPCTYVEIRHLEPVEQEVAAS